MNSNPMTNPEHFSQALEPFLEMLENKEKSLSEDEWKKLVNATKERIVLAPDQYLASGFKSSDSLKATVESIFSERLN